MHTLPEADVNPIRTRRAVITPSLKPFPPLLPHPLYSASFGFASLPERRQPAPAPLCFQSRSQYGRKDSVAFCSCYRSCETTLSVHLFKPILDSSDPGENLSFMTLGKPSSNRQYSVNSPTQLDPTPRKCRFTSFMPAFLPPTVHLY